MTDEEKAELGSNVRVINVPGFAGRNDMQVRRLPLQTGWLKIEGFKILFSEFKSPALFFYIDMDVIFHNFIVPLSSVFVDKPQSIFAQDKLADRMFAPSHAVAVRHTPVAMRFVDDWASLLPYCPHLNMEQGWYIAVQFEYV